MAKKLTNWLFAATALDGPLLLGDRHRAEMLHKAGGSLRPALRSRARLYGRLLAELALM